MIFTATITDDINVSKYTSACGVYVLELSTHGFGLHLCKVRKAGHYSAEFQGHDALPKAQCWCRDDARWGSG